MALPLGPRFLFLLLIQALVPPSSLQLHLDPGLIDRIVRDSAFRSYLVDHQKTAVVYNVSLPPSIPGVAAATVRFRTGSLRRHGAAVGEFRVAPGVVVRPRSRRLVVVAQNLGDLSSAYDGYRNISGFRLVSPVLGLLFYRAASVRNASVPPELEILATRGPITVDFSGLVRCSRGVDGGPCQGAHSGGGSDGALPGERCGAILVTRNSTNSSRPPLFPYPNPFLSI
ncbi:hypothetical protein ZIOFF_003852 [Zingiber officinale]|uniref:Uncharacterized protein n=1 Tax=Zingiber officinale TaxID=94328 RepID=A0A8J5LTT0_ZINOF|nr:hypothetical protein ZIOFF_003852 [Zingiber officinale]